MWRGLPPILEIKIKKFYNIVKKILKSSENFKNPDIYNKKMGMKGFKNSEEVERRFINWFLNENQVKEYDISDIGSFSTNDFTFFSGGTINFGEVKIRSFEYNKYPTIILELDKVNSLLKKYTDIYKMSKGSVYYFAVYPESRCYFMIDLMKTPSTISYENSPVTTVGKNRNYIYKIMLNYQISDLKPVFF